MSRNAARGSPNVTMYPAGENGLAKKQSAVPPIREEIAASPARQAAPIEAELDEGDYASDGSQYESDGGSAPQSPRIANHLASRPDSEAVRKALDVPHVQRNIQTVRTTVSVDVSPADLISGNNEFHVNEKVAQKFMKAITDAAANQLLVGDPSRAQITEVRILGYENELPLALGVEFLQLRGGGSAPKHISGNNGLSFPFILKKESALDFTIIGDGKGRTVYENLNVLPEKLFRQWGGVTKEDLLRGITPIPGTDESLLNIDENKRLVDILHMNQKELERDFPDFSYKDLVKDVRKKRRQVRVWNEVLQKAVDIGVQLALKPINENTTDLRKFGFRVRSTTSEDGGFGDVQQLLNRRLGADLASESVNRSGTVTLDLSVSALIAGTDDGSSDGAESAAPAQASLEGDL